ncbi:MAG: DUF423 domain-containing protein [Gammaproteobacteria bacterium]|nr:DUF423 domain-containing protein [Gammaproteobacteria bacterium]
MTSRATLVAAGLLLALATACAALGAHALKSQLPADRLVLWDTAAQLHFLQALGLMGVGLTLRGRDGAALRASAALIAAGLVLMPGALYALALGAPHALGMLTPLGGFAWIGGWLVYAFGVWRTWA